MPSNRFQRGQIGDGPLFIVLGIFTPRCSPLSTLMFVCDHRLVVQLWYRPFLMSPGFYSQGFQLSVPSLVLLLLFLTFLNSVFKHVDM